MSEQAQPSFLPPHPIRQLTNISTEQSLSSVAPGGAAPALPSHTVFHPPRESQHTTPRGGLFPKALNKGVGINSSLDAHLTSLHRADTGGPYTSIGSLAVGRAPTLHPNHAGLAGALVGVLPSWLLWAQSSAKQSHPPDCHTRNFPVSPFSHNWRGMAPAAL